MVTYSTSYLFTVRNIGFEEGMEGDENEWTVGQILPLMLLSLPLFSIIETYYGNQGAALLDQA